jgi:hypothetical protein
MRNIYHGDTETRKHGAVRGRLSDDRGHEKDVFRSDPRKARTAFEYFSSSGWFSEFRIP